MTDSRINKVLQIAKYAMLLNDKPTKTELTGSKPTVFLDFSGHVCSLEVDIYNEGYQDGIGADEKYYISLNAGYTPDTYDHSQRNYLSKNSERVPADVLLNEVLSRIKELYENWSEQPCKTTD